MMVTRRPFRSPASGTIARRLQSGLRFLAPALSLVLALGCSSRANVGLLEARLRQQEERLVALQTELESARDDADVARRQVSELRSEQAQQQQVALARSPEQAEAFHRTSGIRLNTLLTGGLNLDGIEGDDKLNIVLVPHDDDGELTKVRGRIELSLLDLSLPHADQQIGFWTFSADESTEHWHRGFVGSGYLFKLPWQTTPSASELLLHARLTTSDHRQFDTSATIRVNLPPDGDALRLATPPRSRDAERTISLEREQEPDTVPFGQAPEPNPFEVTAPRKPNRVEEPPLRTSDSWTDQTIPQYR